MGSAQTGNDRKNTGSISRCVVYSNNCLEDRVMAYIELKDVTYTYPLMKQPALKNITASFEHGKFYGVIVRMQVEKRHFVI